MNKTTALCLLALCAVSCAVSTDDEPEVLAVDAASSVVPDAGAASGTGDPVRSDGGFNSVDGASGEGGAPWGSVDGKSDAASAEGGVDGATTSRADAASLPGDAARADASSDGSVGDDSGLSPGDAGPTQSCGLPTTFQWKGGGPLAQPKNGWLAMKDFTHVFHAGQHIVYYTTYQTGWGSGMMTFKDWPDAAAAPQVKTSFGVAPTLFYFTPKNVWILAYQWGPHKFSYRTSTDPTNPNGWSGEKSLYNTALPPNGTGPIDQTVICDRSKCYLYYAGDNGHIYKSSMPIGSFPGEFPAAQDSGIVGTTQNLFEGVQVYKLAGSDKYLMIVEAQGAARYFRAWTATQLDGPWTLLTNDFAVKKNVTLSPNWTNDISHGDLVRSNPDETFTVDPCNLQLVFQGRDPSVNTDYGRLPYRLGLITLQR